MKVASRGSVLVMTLVCFLVFVMIMLAWLRFTTVQNHAVSGQEQEEQSFHLSEAGINWALHILNSGVCTSDQLKLSANQPVIQSVVDISVPESGAKVGTYELTFSTPVGGDTTLTAVHAIGYDKNLPNQCQVIDATLESFAGEQGTKYRIRSWDHKSTVTCGAAGTEKPPVGCVGT